MEQNGVSDKKKLSVPMRMIKYISKARGQEGKTVSAWRGEFFINGVKYEVFMSGNRVPDKNEPKNAEKDTIWIDVSTFGKSINSM